jgi:hypothetical protein
VGAVRRSGLDPTIFTRRAFLQRTAAAGAFLAAGKVLGACTEDGPAGSVARGSAAPASTAATPPPTEPPDTAPPAPRITRVAVHPAVGIARVGNSAESFYFGPEMPLTLPRAPNGFKDASGAIAR